MEKNISLENVLEMLETNGDLSGQSHFHIAQSAESPKLILCQQHSAQRGKGKKK